MPTSLNPSRIASPVLIMRLPAIGLAFRFGMIFSDLTFMLRACESLGMLKDLCCVVEGMVIPSRERFAKEALMTGDELFDDLTESAKPSAGGAGQPRFREHVRQQSELRVI